MPAVDAVAWGAALTLTAAAGRVPEEMAVLAPVAAVVLAVAVGAHVVAGYGLGLYEHRGSPTGLDDVVRLATATAAGALALVCGHWALHAEIGSTPAVVMAWPTALVLALAARLASDRLHARRGAAATTRPVIVFGAGDAGSRLVRSMLADPAAGYRPVAVLDDDPALWRRVSGVPLHGGGRSRIAEVARTTGAATLVIAIPSGAPVQIERISVAAVEAGLRVMVVPPLSALLQPPAGVRDLRDLDIDDLLGREPVTIDVSRVAAHVRGKRIVVTGAGGSIGSELCRQLSLLAPGELILLDRDESALHAVQLSMHGRAMLDSPDVVLADIRDADTLTELFLARRPHLVFHAAALKHLPMLEQYPREAWQTNVLGTLNVLEASANAGVECVVNISTDKAANPVSVLGRSKRITERLVAHMNRRTGRPYLSVRFGNVLGSRGSVLTTFTRQITSGQPLTITHPDVTRYFMTIPEACALVLEASAIGREPEVMVLDMGEPVRIVDLAKQLMAVFGTGTPIVYTGLRDGEKLHEELLGPHEVDHRPLHPRISQVPVEPLGEAEVAGVRCDTGDTAVRMATLTEADAAVPVRRPPLPGPAEGLPGDGSVHTLAGPHGPSPR